MIGQGVSGGVTLGDHQQPMPERNRASRMPTLFRKTALGQTEIETRALRLPPRLRSLLILIDGKRDSAALATLVPQQLEAALQELHGLGLVETIEPAAPPAPVRPVAPPAPSPAAAFEQLRREAVRALNDALGPHAESLALRMEKARTPEELRPLLTQATQALDNLRGRAAGAAYAQKFLPE